MRTPAEVRQFIREVLGCECPDGVFDSFLVERRSKPTTGAPYQWRLVIGQRLLIYIVPLENSGSPNMRLESLRSLGCRDRDSAGLNRFRAVVLVDAASADWGRLEDATAAWALHPRTHLHPVARHVAQSCLASLQRCQAQVGGADSA